jgi:CMP-N-acetylneuraminic acid synthetase
MNVKVLVLIPARSGSKRLPKKNIKMLGTKPLIAWTIDFAKTISGISDIMVSTDDEAIASIARASKAFVPWLRPKELATDGATSVEVAIHALDWYEKHICEVHGVLLLQPTSPFRSREIFSAALDKFISNTNEPIIGVSVKGNASLNEIDSKSKTICEEVFIQPNRFQEMYKAGAIEANGSLYLISPETLRAEQTFFSVNSIGILVPRGPFSLDIDQIEDFEMAEKYIPHYRI